MKLVQRNGGRGIFECPKCQQEVEKDYWNGKKQETCGAKECIPKSKSERHGYVGTPQYTIWANIIQRCTNRNRKDWKNYGGKGITFPEKWRKFEGFWEDMGDKYKPGLSIDRKESSKSYSIENCQWITIKENNDKEKPKMIAKIDKDGNELVRYNSGKEAAEAEGIKYAASITRVARGERTAYKGTHWRYI